MSFILKKRFLYKFMSCFILFTIPAQAEYYAQVGQDAYLNEHIFKNKKNGVFVDVGAHDGISFSNTYFFEKELGWTGVCIEPHPDCFAKLVQQRTARCFAACAGNYEGEVKFLKISGYPEMLSGVLSLYDPAHIARIEAELAYYGGSSQIIAVPMRRLTSMLHEAQLYEIDFLSLDVEGSELEVLQGIDFSQFRIHYILIERNYNQTFKPIADLLIRNGYLNIASFDFDELFELQ